MSDILEWFQEFETDVLPVEQFGIIAQGCLVTHLHLNETGEVEIWAGNPDEDKYAEELLLSKAEARRVLEEACELL